MSPQMSPALQAAIERRRPGGLMADQMPPEGMLPEGPAPTTPAAPAPTPPVNPALLGGQPAAAMQNPGIDDQTKKIIMAAITRLIPLLGPTGGATIPAAPATPPAGGTPPTPPMAGTPGPGAGPMANLPMG